MLDVIVLKVKYIRCIYIFTVSRNKNGVYVPGRDHCRCMHICLRSNNYWNGLYQVKMVTVLNNYRIIKSISFKYVIVLTQCFIGYGTQKR